MSEKKHSNMSLAFGLCMKYGIKIMSDWTPRDAWDALYRKKKITPEQAYAEHSEKSAKRTRTVKLPPKEYAEVCSAIRTAHGNKISPKGDLLHGEHYYQYRYSRRQEKIECTFKLPIERNEELIDAIMEDFKKWQH